VQEVASHGGQRYKSFLPLQKNMSRLLLTLLLTAPLLLFGQDLDEQLQQVEAQLQALERQAATLNEQREGIKLQRIQRDLKDIGLPSEDYIMHAALALEYAEPFEQARWVAHIILPDVTEGTEGRTNDFRVDPLVKTGTAVEEDYFLKYLQPDSSYKYDGFGYDRGHLAPSADFRWSKKALSESYFYSNMSPQVADFNREAWAELEALLRGYLYRNQETQLYVVTGPILEEGLPVIERSVNKVAIPKQFFKVALDVKSGKGIGFVMPNRKIEAPLETFAVSIDEVEQQTGLDFFNQLEAEKEEAVEAALDKSAWIPELAGGDVEPLYPPDLPRDHFNTVQAKKYMGNVDEITVCGTVVSTRYSRSGNLWLNVDKRFPNQIFSVFIRKKDLPNFSYDPKLVLENKQVCFTGEIENFSGTPTMNLEREERIQLGVPEK
jgi:endonuclease G